MIKLNHNHKLRMKIKYYGLGDALRQILHIYFLTILAKYILLQVKIERRCDSFLMFYAER